ncbi:hypothetical protein W02_07170 [Nitrospira sp. KM1]|uniref:beta strand repeat-containing protein n=1 Tax=Nitrospira sp. KM1 TaxID=1936990 RepID=UPI0013A79415|nr:cadherin-like beta sandwich domain-containing protein [Nitrospira sp. KM1]BCA53577.1 hypothetical protein W02_07170 [Nitrospira sp. KM1]
MPIQLFVSKTLRILSLLGTVTFGLYGCNDVSNAPAPTVPPSADSQLSQLTVTPGTLVPTFALTTNNYTVDVTSDITSVTVTALTQHSGASASINQSKATTSQANQSVPLGEPGSGTPIPIVVTAPNGTQNTYVVTVNRAALTGNNSLQSLTISPGTLSPAFDENTLSYSDDVATTAANVTVTATLQDTHATMTINGQPTNPGQARIIPLGTPGSSTQVEIAVTAQNGTVKTYSVTVNKSGGSNNLQGLTISPGTLTPAFAPNTLNYSDEVASNVTNVSVIPTLVDTNATVTVNGQATNSGEASTVSLGVAGSSTTIFIVVTAPSGAQKTYILTVNRAALGGNNNLQSLTVTSGTLAPAFNANTTNYSVNVASGVTSVTVTAQAQDADATVNINGQGTTSRSVTLGGAGSSTPISIVVTAPNGSQKTYLVTVNRAALGGNNNLQNLTVSPGTLAPAFNANTTNYEVDVASGVTSVTVTAQAQDNGATVSINGQSTTNRSVTLGGAGSSTPISIVVTAPNGSQKTYFVTVNRAALGGNNNLQSLTVSPGTLDPAFNTNTTSYSVDVASGVNSVTVTPTLQDTSASMMVNGQGTSSGQARIITLNGPGSSTTISIVVTAPNGSQKTYFVTVNRAALGGNNNLQNLTVSPGTLNPAFNTNTTSYSVDVASNVGNITVTATLQDTNASMTINGQGTSSGQARSISLQPAGSNTTITIIVTAPNGISNPYTITVNRAMPGTSADLSSLTASAGQLQPSFNAATLNYTVAAPLLTLSTTITATLADSNATLTINGSSATSGVASPNILLIPLLNPPINIVVTAQDGVTKKTYTVTITVGP